MKKAKKQIKDIVGTSMLGAGGAIALGGIGGAAAVHGQAGIAGATRFLPAMGTMAGAGMMMRTVDKTFGKKKKRK